MISEEQKEKNLELWNLVEATNPEFTTEANDGGYKFTSANAQWQLMRATEMWGPCGVRWSISHKGQLVTASETEKVWVEEVTIHYPSESESGSVTHYGVAKFCYMTKGSSGYFKVDEQAPKKALTNGVSKALSILGFSADLWLKYYNDPAYVAEITREIEAENKSRQFDNMLKRLEHTLTQTGADPASQDEEILCRYWSQGSYGTVEAHEDETACRAVLNGQSCVTTGKDGREKVPVAKQLEVARKLYFQETGEE